MLQRGAIEPGTLAILKQLMQIPELKDFYLVGGTAVALKYGHRISMDLDLFSSQDFDNEFIASIIFKKFPKLYYQNLKNPIGVFGFIEEIKIDLVKYPHYPLIKDVSIMDGIRIVSDDDLIVMKINTILRRAVKKNFRDLSELLNQYPLSSCIDFYSCKYKKQMWAISIPQAITYFEDAEESEVPISLMNQTWKIVKRNIQQKVRDYLS